MGSWGISTNETFAKRYIKVPILTSSDCIQQCSNLLFRFLVYSLIGTINILRYIKLLSELFVCLKNLKYKSRVFIFSFAALMKRQVCSHFQLVHFRCTPLQRTTTKENPTKLERLAWKYYIIKFWKEKYLLIRMKYKNLWWQW